MKRSVALWQGAGFAVTSIGGSLLHFLYERSHSIWAAPFASVNESTWEHMKLLFWPMLFFALLERCFLPKDDSFFAIKFRGALLGLGLIPLLFYLYNGVIGPSPDWCNVTIFLLAAAAAYLYETRLLLLGRPLRPRAGVALAALLAVGALFVVFTFTAPPLALFQDPLNGTYGLTV